MVAQAQDLWKLVWGKPQIDPNDLAAAVEDEARSDDLDYRTRLLIRDSVEALKGHWGEKHVDESTLLYDPPDRAVPAPSRTCKPRRDHYPYP